MDEFLLRVAECLDREIVLEDDRIIDFPEWDSLAILTLIALIGSNYGVNLTAREIHGIETAGELWKLVNSRKR